MEDTVEENQQPTLDYRIAILSQRCNEVTTSDKVTRHFPTISGRSLDGPEGLWQKFAEMTALCGELGTICHEAGMEISPMGKVTFGKPLERLEGMSRWRSDGELLKGTLESLHARLERTDANTIEKFLEETGYKDGNKPPLGRMITSLVSALRTQLKISSGYGAPAQSNV